MSNLKYKNQQKYERVQGSSDLSVKHSDTANTGFQKSLNFFQQKQRSISSENDNVNTSVLKNRTMLGNNEGDPGGERSGPLLFHIKDLELEKAKEMYREEEQFDPFRIDDISFSQINLVPLIVKLEVQRLWDFCVAYASCAMFRRADAIETVSITNGPVGLFYFGAVTLFYSLYQCMMGQLPLLQRMSQELIDLFHAVSPTIKNGKMYSVEDPGNISSIVASLPYTAFANPGISLAPFLNSQGPQGRTQIQNANVTVLIEDIENQGADAFELVQRYFLGDPNVELEVYTESGPYFDNTSVFAIPRDINQISPINGVFQVVSETQLPQKDYWAIALGFFMADPNLRDGWNVRTVQGGTHLAILRMIAGAANTPNRALIHMVNYNIELNSDLVMAIAAEINADDDQTLAKLNSVPNLSLGYLDQIFPGEFMTYVLMILSRRYGIMSCACAGTPMPDSSSTVIGGGSFYLTTAVADAAIAWLGTIEERANTSAFIYDGTIHMPVLTSRNPLQTVDFTSPGGSSLLAQLNNAYPTTVGMVTSYNMAAPTPPNELPTTLDFTNSGSVSHTHGSGPDSALESVSSMVASLQPYCNVGAATGNRDGAESKMLNLTHYIDDYVDQSGYDLAFNNGLHRVTSVAPFSPKHVSNVFCRKAGVMFGPTEHIPAYQAIYGQNSSTIVGERFSQFVSMYIISHAHKRASNIDAPNELDSQFVTRTVLGLGGNFIDEFFVGGKWVDALSLLAGGLANKISPKFGKFIKSAVKKGGDAIHGALSDPKLKYHTAPVSHGLISKHRFIELLSQHQSIVQQPKKQQQRSNTPRRKGKKRR